jgi:hypothetical protein
MLPPSMIGPWTQAVQRALAQARDRSALDDLLFLERWEMAPQPGAAAALRVSQIRRANPELARAVRDEIAAALRPGADRRALPAG